MRRLIEFLIARFAGGGVQGFVAASAWRKVRGVAERDAQVEVVLTDDLIPGEEYVVVARPAPTRAEVKLEKRLAGLTSQLRAAQRPSRKVRSTAREIQKVQKRLGKASPESRRARKLASREQRLFARLDKADRRGPRRDALAAQRAEVDSALAALRRERIEAVRRHNTKKISRRQRRAEYRRTA